MITLKNISTATTGWCMTNHPGSILILLFLIICYLWGNILLKRYHKLNEILRLPLSKGNPKDKLVSIHFLNFIVLRKGIIYLDHICLIINLWSDNQLRSSSFVSSKSLWTRLWKLKRPTKCLVFLCKIIHNVLSVKAELQKRHGCCVFYEIGEETAGSSFSVREVWFASNCALCWCPFFSVMGQQTRSLGPMTKTHEGRRRLSSRSIDKKRLAAEQRLTKNHKPAKNWAPEGPKT